MGMEEGLQLIENIFFGTQYFSLGIFITIALILLVMVCISKDYSDWGVIAFPIALGLIAADSHIHLLIVIGTGIGFAISALTQSTYGLRLLGFAKSPLEDSIRRGR